MIRGAEALCREFYDQGRFQGVISIGGAQGTDIGTAAMRSLPIGVPRLMVSTVASGRAMFGPYVGTKDIAMMHSVADLQGLNFLTRRILENAAGAQWRSRKFIVHNPNLTLVRLNPEATLSVVGKLVAEKLNRGRGPIQVFIPLRGFSYPDREGLPHWEPKGNQAFIDSLKAHLNPSTPLIELDAHINDPEFIDPVALGGQE